MVIGRLTLLAIIYDRLCYCTEYNGLNNQQIRINCCLAGSTVGSICGITKNDTGCMACADIQNDDMALSDIQSVDIKSGDIARADIQNDDMALSDIQSGDTTREDIQNDDMARADIQSGNTARGSPKSGDIHSESGGRPSKRASIDTKMHKKRMFEYDRNTWMHVNDSMHKYHLKKMAKSNTQNAKVYFRRNMTVAIASFMDCFVEAVTDYANGYISLVNTADVLLLLLRQFRCTETGRINECLTEIGMYYEKGVCMYRDVMMDVIDNNENVGIASELLMDVYDRMCLGRAMMMSVRTISVCMVSSSLIPGISSTFELLDTKIREIRHLLAYNACSEGCSAAGCPYCYALYTSDHVTANMAGAQVDVSVGAYLQQLAAFTEVLMRFRRRYKRFMSMQKYGKDFLENAIMVARNY